MYKISYGTNQKSVKLSTVKEVKKFLKEKYPEPNITLYGLLPTIKSAGSALFYNSKTPTDDTIHCIVYKI